jgi:hypothetical protein
MLYAIQASGCFKRLREQAQVLDSDSEAQSQYREDQTPLQPTARLYLCY